MPAGKNANFLFSNPSKNIFNTGSNVFRNNNNHMINEKIMENIDIIENINENQTGLIDHLDKIEKVENN